MKKWKRVLLIGLTWLVPATNAAAQAATPDAADRTAALAKQVQNPIANLITLPFQYNYNLDVGPYEREFANLNIQPVIPFPGKTWNVITRTIIPVNSVPVDSTGSIFGIGDINLSVFWSPAQAKALTWGAGFVAYLPTASNSDVLGSGKFSLGPTGVIFFTTGKWTMGGVASNAWSVAGDGNREDVNFFYTQYFVNYNFGKGWAVGSAPIVTCNWEAPSGERWVVPWGLQVSKVTHFGTRPANLLAGYYHNGETPTHGAEGQVRVQVNLLFPARPR